MTVRLALIAPLLLAGCVSVHATETVDETAPLKPITRTYTNATAPYARTLVIPPGYETVRLPGIVPDPISPGVYGDTEQQTASTLMKIRTQLAEAGATEADVVAATVYLVAPPGQTDMDFAAMNRAWAKHFGSPDQPNRPVRSTVRVAGLVAAGVLVEIEVTAARRPR
jgi:enamine deaminase RidA (YjgF/YER057c/UK114 family)